MAALHTKALAYVAGAAFLLTASVAPAKEAGSEVEARYTAQSPPRVAVLEFDNSNTEAEKAGYASSAEAMLVTFLQKRSQLLVVEREDVGGLYEEKRRIQMGLVDPEGADAHELLEKSDVFILGTVTLLEGSQVEIDTKLFSGFDSRVVATAQRSGPANCLRSIVERLGIALEQDFLRPYQGNLEIRLTRPENVSIFLAPIPLNTASDQERTPVERSSATKIGDGYDTVEPWITNPTSYTIKNLLPGWYSLRLARPGYEDFKMDGRRWEVRPRSGRLEVVDRTAGLPLGEAAPDLRRFVVRVQPETTEVVDGDALGFSLRKKGGSLAPRVKREYLDRDYTHVPERAVLMGGKGLDLNPLQSMKKIPNTECHLLRDRPFSFPDHGLTHVAVGQTFDFGAFQGGELIIEDYKGEIVPSGQYEMVLWDSHFGKKRIEVVTVRDGDRGKEVRTDLDRETLPLQVEATGAHPENHVILEGRETDHRIELLLDFTGVKEVRGLPVDTYKVSTDIPGLDRWKQALTHLPGTPVPPQYYTESSRYKPETTRTYKEKTARTSSLIVKTRFALGGRLEALSRSPDSRTADLFIDQRIEKLLDLLLQEQGRQPGPSEEMLELAQRLDAVDLLILNPRDMARLRQVSEVAALVRDYIQKGGALFAFVVGPGDYGTFLGAPLVIEGVNKPASFGSWRVLAFTQGREKPRILERGEKDKGGYVALWLDDPASFRDRFGRAVSKLQETRGKVEEHVLNWARYLMYRRYEKSGKLRRQAEEKLGW